VVGFAATAMALDEVYDVELCDCPNC
jgi:hypothetical protein